MSSNNRLETIYTKEMRDKNIKAKDIVQEGIEDKHKEKLLEYKKYTLHKIVADGVDGIIGLYLSGLLVYATDIDSIIHNGWNIAIILGIVVLILSLIGCIYLLWSVPKRLNNYFRFNFERTCYVEVISKYTKKSKQNNCVKTYYYANIKTKEDYYIRGIRLHSMVEYALIDRGDTVVLASFDGYDTTVVNIK